MRIERKLYKFTLVFQLLIFIVLLLMYFLAGQKGVKYMGFIFLLSIITLYLFRRNSNIILFLFTCSFIYISAEVFFYFRTCNKISNHENITFYAFNKPCSYFDSISGFRWKHDTFRVAQITNGIYEFDNVFVPNKQGYISHKNFEYSKGPNSYRYICLGNSFTAGTHLETTWPDRVEELINKDKDSNWVYQEFYNFGLDGVGLYNWYTVFTREIVPHYEFDALIMPVYLDNLNRKFYIMHHNDSLKKGAQGYLEDIDISNQEFINNYYKYLTPNPDIFDDKWLDEKFELIKKDGFVFASLRSHLIDFLKGFDYIYDRNSRIKEYYRTRDQQYLAPIMLEDENYSTQFFIDRYGKRGLDMLDSIFGYCIENKKRMIICVIPDQHGITTNENGSHTILQADLAYLSGRYNTEFFDSFKYFENINKKDQKQYWYPLDNHWNQAGSDLFSEKFTKYLEENYPKSGKFIGKKN